MACTAMSVATSPTAATTEDSLKGQILNRLNRSISGKNLCRRERIRRSYSDNNLCYSINRVQASMNQPKLRNSRSMGIFNFHLPGKGIPNSLRSLLFDPETSKEMTIEENSDETKNNENMKLGDEKQKRANWIERLMEIRGQWVQKQHHNGEVDGDGNGHGKGEKGCDGREDEGGCDVDYSDDEGEENININRESFSRLLRRVSWSDTKHFSQLAFLSNMAYVVPEIKAEDLRRYYDLDFVTSSLEKKELAEAVRAKFEQDSIRVPVAISTTNKPDSEKSGTKDQKRLTRSCIAYEIAASAASYVHSRAKDLLSRGTDPHQEEEEEENDVTSLSKDDRELAEEENSSPRIYNSEIAMHMAASTMTAVVAAGKKEKQQAAKDLQSLHSSPCEWFVCDDTSIYTRCFIIQGSDSVASWQANLFFDPIKFEDTDVLVHRGIYEAAKGIYEQFMPQILEHLHRYGERAKFQFTGHSLGGSLSLLVNLMLLTRNVVKPSALRPVVTFGSPFVFCGGQKILDALGLDENHVHCVMMHRDIVPRAFSCNYPNHAAQLLKRLSGNFQSHPCLNRHKLLYSPMGKIFILQPDEKSSPPHPLLPPGSALYALEDPHYGSTKSALRAFLNSPHPLHTLSHPTAYGSDGTILRDHDSSNYLKAVNGIIRQQTKIVVRRVRKHRNILWPLLTSQSPHAWSQERTLEEKRLVTADTKMLVSTEVMTGA